MKVHKNLFNDVIAPEQLFAAWDEFRKGKGNKPDILRFERELEQNIFELYHELKNKTYQHGPYRGFYISDPKVRHIHKATVRDRVVHHAVFKVLNRIFEPTFIADSFSCRVGKGTHRGVTRVQAMIRKVSRNGTRPCYVLKCDVRKFFDSVDHDILLAIIKKRINDPDVLWLLEEIIESYPASNSRERERVKRLPRKGIPIGNLTSQIFANIYMNEFDQFMKYHLQIKNYARYTDDFVAISRDRASIEQFLLPHIRFFLNDALRLALHSNKVFIQPFHRGVDFLGYVIFPHHRLLRTRTRKRMLKKLKQRAQEHTNGLRTNHSLNQVLQSYLGALSHANAYKLSKHLKNQLWFWLSTGFSF